MKFIVIHEYTIFLKYTINTRTKLKVSKYTKIHTRRKLVKYTKYTIHENNKKSELYCRKVVLYRIDYRISWLDLIHLKDNEERWFDKVIEG